MNIAESLFEESTSAEASSLDFRQIMRAMSYPGRVCHCLSHIDETAISSVNKSAQQIANALVTREVSVSYFQQALTSSCEKWIRLQLRSQMVALSQADFVFTNGECLADLNLEDLSLGTALAPDKSATLIVSVNDQFNKPSARPLQLSGPGIDPKKGPTIINLPSIATSFFEQRASLAPLFPMGVDVFFCSEQDFIALPRTTQVNW